MMETTGTTFRFSTQYAPAAAVAAEFQALVVVLPAYSAIPAIKKATTEMLATVRV